MSYIPLDDTHERKGRSPGDPRTRLPSKQDYTGIKKPDEVSIVWNGMKPLGPLIAITIADINYQFFNFPCYFCFHFRLILGAETYL